VSVSAQFREDTASAHSHGGSRQRSISMPAACCMNLLVREGCSRNPHVAITPHVIQQGVQSEHAALQIRSCLLAERVKGFPCKAQQMCTIPWFSPPPVITQPARFLAASAADINTADVIDAENRQSSSEKRATLCSVPCSSHRPALSANACSNDRVTISLRFPVPSLARRCANLRTHLRGKRWRCKSQPCKRTMPVSGTPVRTNADRVRVYRPWCSSLRKGHNTNTRRLSAASADGARVPLRTILMCSRLVLRLRAMAATRDATDPCASRLCLLSMARALPAERLLRKRLPHVRHTETAMRTLLGARTEVLELHASQYCMR